MRNWLVLALVLAAAASFYAVRMMTAPGSGTMLELNTVMPDMFVGRILKKERRGYVRTPAVLRVRLDAATRFVMGDRSDLRPGAIVAVSGDRIVVLTGYVRVR
jgi:hypothetical protein